jgi:choline-glycine betaine transporter
VLVVAIILVSVLLFSLSRFGDIKLGPDHAEPAYSGISWFSMLFAAGMGIGLMFFGVAEPVMHFLQPPHGVGGTPEAASTGPDPHLFPLGTARLGDLRHRGAAPRDTSPIATACP